MPVNNSKPNPAHHTKRGFKNNYTASVEKPLGELLRWQWQRMRAGVPKPPKRPTPRQAVDLEFLQKNAAAGTLMKPCATWIGHSTVLMQASGLTVVTDPVFSERASPFKFAGPQRAQSPAIPIEALPPLSAVVISHNHYDHLDRASVVTLARRQPELPFLVPLGLAAWFKSEGIERVTELDWWQSTRIGPVDFTLTPTQHWSGRFINDRSRTLWGAWAALAPDFHWYFGGDSGYSPDFVDTARFFESHQSENDGGGFDLAMIAVGAYEPRWFMREQHVEPSESVQIHKDLKAKRSLAIHWGTFSLTDESLDEPVLALERSLALRDVPEDQFRTLAIGETWALPARVVRAT
jgi:N-acyl-phosphatidylethanolamine-hydrolysing phospholipase D